MTVKAVKHLIAKCSESGDLDNDDFAMGLLELRNTPRTEGRSPAQILFGHPLRSNIPVHHGVFAKEHQKAMDECDMKRNNTQEKIDARYTKAAKALSSFGIGHHVNIQHPRTGQWDKNGVIVGIGKNRDYLVKLNSGRIYWRNRRFLRTHHVLSQIAPGNRPEVVRLNSPQRQSPQIPVERIQEDDQTNKFVERRSGRHTMKPKRLIMEPRVKIYKDDGDSTASS